MKISICIPVYNFDVRELVADLNKEIANNQLNAEILLIDDASEPEFILKNSQLINHVENFVFLEKNVGRSQIRNLFLYYAKGEFLLYLDCDGKIISPNFLLNYKNYVLENPKTKVIYGGRNVSEIAPEKNHFLRWKYSIERENPPISIREKNTYLTFQTNNFLVKKTVLEKVNFNPEFQKYGYEDLLFAMNLKTKKMGIQHIDNPILNNDVETNEEYLRKVEESAESLAKMMKNKNTKDKISEIKLVKAYKYMDRSGMTSWFQKLFDLRAEKTKQKLLQGDANLRYLDFYKLGLLIKSLFKN